MNKILEVLGTAIHSRVPICVANINLGTPDDKVMKNIGSDKVSDLLS